MRKDGEFLKRQRQHQRALLLARAATQESIENGGYVVRHGRKIPVALRRTKRV